MALLCELKSEIKRVYGTLRKLGVNNREIHLA